MPRLLMESVVVEFPCECGGRCTVTQNGERYALVHTMPYCLEFERMDADEYLQRNRQRIARGKN